MDASPLVLHVRRSPAPRAPGRFRYEVETPIGRHQDLVLRAHDGEVVVRRSGRRANDGVAVASWVDERPDLTAEVVDVN